FPEDIPPGPSLHGTTEERERMCLDYCRRMPGASRLHLEPGDWFIYRNTMWHTGNYVPYAKRATILDVVDTPRYREWREKRGLAPGHGVTGPFKRIRPDPWPHGKPPMPLHPAAARWHPTVDMRRSVRSV